MSKIILDEHAVSVLSEFCDVNMLTNRIELIDAIKDDYLMELGECDDEKERKSITDKMISLQELNMDLKKIRRAQK